MAESSGEKRWYELPILVTVLGSILLLIGNVVTNFVPIMFGAEDSSDFYITIDNVYIEPKYINESKYISYMNFLRDKLDESRIENKAQKTGSDHRNELLPRDVPVANVTVFNTHEYLRRYNYPVYIKAIGAPSNLIINFAPPQDTPKFSSNMLVYIKTNKSLLSADNIIGYPITIQGIGGDGKKRNCSADIYFIPPKFHVNDIGIPRMTSGDYKGALESFEAAINLNKSYAEAWNYKGKALQALGFESLSTGKFNKTIFEETNKEALKSFQEAIRLNENYEDARYNYAFALYNMKRYKESLHELEIMTKLNESSARGWIRQAEIQKKLKMYNESFYAYNKTLSLKQIESIGAWDFSDLGEEASSSNDYDVALKAYARASEIEPDVAYFKHKRMLLLYQLNRFNDSIEFADSAIEADPEDTYSWIVKSLALYGLGMRDDADNVYKTAKKISSSSDIWSSISWQLYKLNRYNESLRLASTAIEIDPNDSASWDTKGAALIGLGMNEDAVKSLDKAIEIRPRAIRFFHKAKALVDLGNDEDALKNYEKAIQEEPDSPDGWNGKAEILRKLGREDEADAALAKAKELEDSGYGHYSGWDDEMLVVSIDYLPAV